MVALLPVTANSNNRLPATVAVKSNRTILKLATVRAIRTWSQILGAFRAKVSNSSNLAITHLPKL